MKIPDELRSLIDDGVIDAVVRSLKSGKEAAVFIVRQGQEIRCAKVYKNLSQRSFQQRARYQEGRQVRGSRQRRAMGKGTRFGRSEAESAWKSTEVDALYRLQEAGVRVPSPYGYFDGVLIMELVTDADGGPAPGLGDVDFTAAEARDIHRLLVGQIQLMFCAGLIHGDLSEYNVLLGADGPVIIDLPQAVNAAANNSAREMLLRDVGNITETLSRFAPELAGSRFGEELWQLFEAGDLHADSVLTGSFVEASGPVDVDEVQQIIESAREEAVRRQRGREEAE